MTYTQCKDYIRSDYYRVSGKLSNSLFRMFLLSFMDVGFRFLFWFRLTKCDNRLLSIFARVLYFWLGQKHHIYIPRSVKIGYGFKILHGGPVVITDSAQIGNNVNIGQFSTIGSVSFRGAIIGNNVYIGPSACIVENVHIGDGVTIGAGSVVVKDFQGGVTVAGNPAKVISQKEPGRFIWRRWDTKWNKSDRRESTKIV